MGLRKRLASVHRNNSAAETSLAGRAFALLVCVFVLSVILVLRILPEGPPAGWSYDSWVAMAISALPALAALAGLLLLLPRFRTALSSLEAGTSLPFGIVLAGWSVSLACLDQLASRQPTSLFLGAIVLGLLYWNRLLNLALMGLPALAVFAGFAFFVSGADAVAETALRAAFAAGLGVFAVILTRRSTAPSQERLRSLEAENKELWNLSFRDGLTGLYNRRFAQETGATMFTRALRYHEELHVLMIDIDHFKKVNDKLGHPVGDIVLRDVADIIKANVRSSDMAARYGGEEFIIFIVRAEPELVQFVANRIRDGIAAHSFENVPWQVTVSIGVASIQPNDTLEELVDRSDKFLYLSKHSGRNRVSGS